MRHPLDGVCSCSLAPSETISRGGHAKWKAKWRLRRPYTSPLALIGRCAEGGSALVERDDWALSTPWAHTHTRNMRARSVAPFLPERVGHSSSVETWAGTLVAVAQTALARPPHGDKRGH